jgi:hypothetical protein
MPFVSRRAQLKLSETETETLTALRQSRSEPAGRVRRNQTTRLERRAAAGHGPARRACAMGATTIPQD